MSSTYGILTHYPLTNEACNDARKVNANLQALESAAAGRVSAAAGFACSGSTGLGGVLVLDDGANWRVTLTFKGGILTGQSIAATSAATATWT